MRVILTVWFSADIPDGTDISDLCLDLPGTEQDSLDDMGMGKIINVNNSHVVGFVHNFDTISVELEAESIIRKTDVPVT